MVIHILLETRGTLDDDGRFGNSYVGVKQAIIHGNLQGARAVRPRSVNRVDVTSLFSSLSTRIPRSSQRISKNWLGDMPSPPSTRTPIAAAAAAAAAAPARVLRS